MMTEDQLKQHISQRAKEILPEMIAFRRHLHQFPELSFEEYNTSSFIKEFLKKKQC
jgi:metal-dependent amidase/aminoacylase/carboxypeptidase family protein